MKSSLILACLVFSFSMVFSINVFADNQEDCEAWCESNEQCARCSHNIGCGSGYKRMATFKRYSGRNWYACRQRDNFPVYTQSNEEACNQWCESIPECERCDMSVGCGVGYRRIATFKDRPGRNWYACQRR